MTFDQAFIARRAKLRGTKEKERVLCSSSLNYAAAKNKNAYSQVMKTSSRHGEIPVIVANTLYQRTRDRDGFLSLDIIAGGAWRLKIYRGTGKERKFLPPPQRNPGYRRCFLPHTAGCFGLQLTQRSGE